MLKVLYGRRKAAQRFVEYLAGKLLALGFLRCPAAPHFFRKVEAEVTLDIHIDDVNGVGEIIHEIEKFTEKTGEMIPIKFAEVYEFWQRPKVRSSKL